MSVAIGHRAGDTNGPHDGAHLFLWAAQMGSLLLLGLVYKKSINQIGSSAHVLGGVFVCCLLFTNKPANDHYALEGKHQPRDQKRLITSTWVE